ncbi:hypothetical protein COU76_04135 [Candidatus Peregrinibacteria bacterium CG10_big_fil_rev_8_21_14_0_10_49_10]|nr:MAG: hypothetical protein COU76_04135 [Candidatus Peregrinibacteria bacterium CG10_big_fil_rev_8_21_14_0_10_49_10]
MTVVAMQKVAILAHASLKEDLLEALHREGVVQISESHEAVRVDHTQVQYKEAELRFAIETLKNFASKETLTAMHKGNTEESIFFAAEHTDVRGIVETLHRLEEEDTEALRHLQELESLQQMLEPWSALPYPLNTPTQTHTTMRILGTLPQVQIQLLQENSTKRNLRADLEVVQTEGATSAIAAHVWKEDAEAFESLATEAGWTTVELPALETTAAEFCTEATMQCRALQKKRKENNALRAKLSVELPNLTKTAQFLVWLDQKQQAREAMMETTGTVTLLGWMPRNRMALLEVHLQKLSKAIALLKVKADAGEEPPVLLRNPKIITPFQSVTNLYGLPLYNEFDPTAALSPFFILYFSLCLTDAGYGAVIALIFGTILYKSKKTVEEATLLWLLFIGGIVTFLVSIPFGGWFGLAPEQVPAFLTRTGAEGSLLFKGQIWDLSAESGITFLQNLSLILGLTHLFFGMFLAGMHKWIHGNRAAALWMDFTSHLLLGTIIFAALSPESLAGIKMYPLYAGIALFIWGKGYGNRWFLRPIAGLLGAINFCVGMISNTLSYLRILALGLVTGALAMAVNQVAVQLGNLFPLWVAVPLIVIIFLVGHLVSIALNTLGSFIHSGRLQFIEFFSQFFEGGGKNFSPYRRSLSS